MKILDNLHAFVWFDPAANNCNTYLLEGEKRILVDPGHNHLFGHVQDGLSELSLTPQDIDLVILTHGHPDHMEGVKTFSGTSTLIAIHRVEMDFIKSIAPHYGEALGISGFEPEIFLQEGDLRIGNWRFQVLHTPGHSPGSICLYLSEKKVLFTGDVVFNQGIGRTDLPGGSGLELKESIQALSQLETDYLLPGHGEILSGCESVDANFKNIERDWFPYL